MTRIFNLSRKASAMGLPVTKAEAEESRRNATEYLKEVKEAKGNIYGARLFASKDGSTVLGDLGEGHLGEKDQKSKDRKA
jgi:hypothetical protein